MSAGKLSFVICGVSLGMELREICVLVCVGRRAAAEEAERFARGDGVPCARRNEDGIAVADGACGAVDLHFARAFEDEIKLLREPVVMPLRGRAGGHAGLGERLLFYGRIGAVEDAADGRAVLGGEGFLVGEVEHGHGGKGQVPGGR